MRSKSYNLLETENLNAIESIKANGHQISFHFDPTIYENIEEGLEKERSLFKHVFGVDVGYFSIHQPAKHFIGNPEDIGGLGHTYQPAFFSKIKYFSDSLGVFQHGHPLDSSEFHRNETIQLLIHPIWWISDDDPLPCLQKYLDYKIEKFKRHMANSCKTYREYLEGE